MNDVEKGAQPVDLKELSGQGAGQIEPKAVDVHLGDPVAQAVHDELQHARMLHIGGVATAGEVHVVARILRREPVVGGVVDAAHRQRGAELIAFGGVVVDHVQNHFNAGRVQGGHHHLELLHRILWQVRRGIAAVGRKKAEGVIAPVIGEAPVDEMPVVEKVVHRQQFDGGDPQVGQMADRRPRRPARHRCRGAVRGPRGAIW